MDVTVARLLSLEGLHHAVMLVYLAWYRRANAGDTTCLAISRAPQLRDKFLDYFNIERQIPNETIVMQNIVELAMMHLMNNPLLEPTANLIDQLERSSQRPTPSNTPSKPGHFPTSFLHSRSHVPPTQQWHSSQSNDCDKWLDEQNLSLEYTIGRRENFSSGRLI